MTTLTAEVLSASHAVSKAMPRTFHLTTAPRAPLLAEQIITMPTPTYSGTNSQGNSYTTYSNGGYSYNNGPSSNNNNSGSHYYSPSGGTSGFYTQNGGKSGGGYSYYQNSGGTRSYK